MRIKLLVSIIVFFCNNTFYPKSKEVVFNTTSSFVLQNDSLSQNYKSAKVFFEKEDYANALREAQKIVEVGSSYSSEELVLTNYLIANIFYSTKSYDNAIKYYKKTLDLVQQLKDVEFKSEAEINFDKDFIKAEAYLNFGNSYYQLYNKDYLQKHKDSALFFYDKVDDFFSSKNNVLEVKSRAYSNSSVIYLNDTLFDKARDYAMKAIQIHRNQNNKVNEAGALVNLSNIYLSENNFKKAKETYYEALDLIRNEKSSKALIVREKIYFNLAYNLYKLKDYQAYFYQELSYNIKDSLREQEVRGIIEELDAQYDFKSAKKLLLKEEENKRLKAQRTFWVIGIGGFIIILSLLYWLNLYKLRQKNLGLQLSQNQLILNQNIEKIKSESQVRILNATIDGKESERKDIAETLHDSVSALLSSANLHLQATRSQFKGDHPIEIDKTQEIITEASQKIRDLSHTLVSSVLLKFGLKYAVKDMADKYSNSQLKFETEVGKVRRYHQSFEIKVYNIIQEFLNNILKHSKAENATIKLNEENSKLIFVISDDGVGFDKSKISDKDGLGLNQIDARIQVMNGRFHINSSVNNGTTIEVELPILEKPNHV
ncbi:tetratricopeptide repeat-containing sensor histidine kinase [Polaribacter pectinis]|uniref:tetratricopeptide repeat-containing sensor histidine kinase n=1 Tax=Polaribacter pectinis TaxID=2738844 RepID=UPI0020C7EAA5|nr:tetratricopeptide repeat-containing sensor histidine kinase [Polaribacter pectinis]